MIDHHDHAPGDTAPEALETRTKAARGRRFPGPWVGLVLGVCILLLILLRSGALRSGIEQGAVNVATYALGLICIVTLAAWFFLFSGYALRTRALTLAAVVLAVLALASLFRFKGFTGDLWPIFAWRWTPQANLALDVPAEPPERIDLETTGPRDYPGFLGPQRDAHLEGVGLDPDWQADPPRLLWRNPIGAGWSAFAVVNGFAVTMEQRGSDELVSCYALETGELVWWHAVTTRHETVMGGLGPRGTPTIHGGRVFALGATGVLRCLDGGDGSLVWSDDLLARIGVTADEDREAIAWGRAASPLIVDDRVVLPLGGPAGGPCRSAIAYDQADGRVVWTAGDRQASYSSPQLATLGGVRQILIVCQDYVGGYDARGGTRLWEHPWPGSSSSNANVSQAVPVGQDRVLVSKGYGGGSELLQVRAAEDGAWQVTTLWKDSRILRTKFSNVVVHRGHVYGLSDGILQCVQLDSGQRLWRGGRYGQGQILGADELLLVQAESGDVALVAASPDSFQELAVLPALSSKTWNNPALYGKHLLVRNGEQAACYLLP